MQFDGLSEHCQEMYGCKLSIQLKLAECTILQLVASRESRVGNLWGLKPNDCHDIAIDLVTRDS